jgi:uncharacterized Ntn-hydrolase superfamily protein
MATNEHERGAAAVGPPKWGATRGPIPVRAAPDPRPRAPNRRSSGRHLLDRRPRPATGDLGVAVASKFLAVGAYVPAAKAGVGAVATQAHVNTTYMTRALDLLRAARRPTTASGAFRADDAGIETRQFGIVAADGSSATFTAGRATPGRAAWRGRTSRRRATSSRAPRSWTRWSPRSPKPTCRSPSVWCWPWRRRTAWAATVAAASRRRCWWWGRPRGTPGLTDRWIDLRVDDHPDPVVELGRLLELHRLFLDKPSAPPRPLSEHDVRWVQDLLRRTKHLDRAPTGVWDEATERALEGLFGVENLEERWTTGPRMDPVAWEHLQRTFGGREP